MCRQVVKPTPAWESAWRCLRTQTHLLPEPASNNTGHCRISWVTPTALLSWLVQVQPPHILGQHLSPRHEDEKDVVEHGEADARSNISSQDENNPSETPFGSEQMEGGGGKRAKKLFLGWKMQRDALLRQVLHPPGERTRLVSVL